MARPVIANEHPEQSLVMAESGAGICVSWDETAFADGIIELLKNPKTAARMGLMGRKWVEQYRTNKRMADIVEDQYVAMLGKSENGRVESPKMPSKN
jgi:glycosyltransferase involved in cell wall biosynthesis